MSLSKFDLYKQCLLYNSKLLASNLVDFQIGSYNCILNVSVVDTIFCSWDFWGGLNFNRKKPEGGMYVFSLKIELFCSLDFCSRGLNCDGKKPLREKRQQFCWKHFSYPINQVFPGANMYKKKGIFRPCFFLKFWLKLPFQPHTQKKWNLLTPITLIETKNSKIFQFKTLHWSLSFESSCFYWYPWIYVQ